MTEPTEVAAGPPNRLPVLLAAGLGAVVLILVLTALVGGGGGGDDDDASSTSTTAARRVATTTTVAGTAPVETFEVFASKNPFVPLRRTGGATGGTTTGGTTTGGTTTGGTTGGTTSGGTTSGGTTATTTGGGATSGGTTGGGSTEPRRSDRVTLLDVFAEGGRVVANVRVNDTVHKVGVNDTFATSYKVLSLSQADDCGRFSFGDDTFRLCRGEQTLK